ncbi:phytase [Vibrio diazotrophicus]|uniref:3-phytase n=1 Tax=Vibrio diazotrophicus TaxID=685 RepID=A0ABX4W8Z8_VIBDI|nr:phytase [Vibrio diazotrophicus]PNH99290.1 3-phytase [Vibrio diazotrophicus]
MSVFKYSVIATALTLATSSYAANSTQTSYENIADSAVWQSKSASLLIASLEDDGVAVYNDKGMEIQRIDSEPALGVDVRYELQSDSGKSVDVAAIGLPDSDAIGLYAVDANSAQPLKEVGRIKLNFKPEGVCLIKNVTTGTVSVIGYSESGLVAQFKLMYNDNQVTSLFNIEGKASPVRELQVGGELSGCVSDDVNGKLYVLEQDLGIWSYGNDPENVTERQLVNVVEPLGSLKELENIDIINHAGGKATLVVADEGNGFFLFDSQTHKQLASFNIEGVEEAKLVSVGKNELWIGNTEADEPMYQSVNFDELSEIVGYKVANTVPPKEMKVEGIRIVKASAETQPVNKSGDAADDPAFWLNVNNPDQSLIIATNKKKGLMAYRLNGEEVQFLKAGKPNNIDIRQNLIDSKGNNVDLAAASNRELNTIALYTITEGDEPIKVLPAKGKNVHQEGPELVSQVGEVYGLCMGQSTEGTPYVYVNGKNGIVEQWKITLNNGYATGEMVRRVSVPTQPEGCVVDDKTQTLYVGEEDNAIWQFDARENGSTEAKLFAKVDGKQITDDVEGLSLYQNGQDNLLIASSQGSHSYAVFDLNQNGKFAYSFAVIGDDSIGVDGASETDGIHAVATPLGSQYPDGIFIAQDGFNVDKEYHSVNQNFKIVDWRSIAK